LCIQTRNPDIILIADGGSKQEFLLELKEKVKYNIELKIFPGSINETRTQVIDYLKGKTDIIAFIDSHEWAEHDWLERLICPIEKGIADFTGGCVKFPLAKTEAEHILGKIKTKNQLMLEKDMSYLPMGNSAWKFSIFDAIGTFDKSSSKKDTGGTWVKDRGISEDFDINLRAIDYGFKGVYVPDAVAWHDESHIDRQSKVIKYFYTKFVRTSMTYFKHKRSLKKFTSCSVRTGMVHPLEGVLFLMKPIALVHGWKKWNDIRKMKL
jgi:glycosyltransferase involved in cell wall biosynthesis